MTTIRLNHYLSLAGVASRRAADTLIEQGNVRVDDTLVKTLGTKIDPAVQKVTVRQVKSGQWELVEEVKEKVTYIMYKPRGYTTTLKGQRGERTIMEFLPKNLRLFPVGRLDKESEGLLILTNDGDLALHLSHPSTHIEKTYRVWCRMPSEYTENAVESQLGRIRGGIKLDGKRTMPMKIRVLATKKGTVDLEIVLQEGRHRQIRRILGRINLEVIKLIRIKIGNISLDDFVDLKEGELIQLSEDRVRDLRE